MRDSNMSASSAVAIAAGQEMTVHQDVVLVRPSHLDT